MLNRFISTDIYNNVVSFFDTCNELIWNLITVMRIDQVFDFYGGDRVNFRYGATSVSENILSVYNTIIFIELMLFVAIIWILLWTYINFGVNDLNEKSAKEKYLVHYSFYKNKTYFTSKAVEFVWTVLPIMVLFFIGYPSLVLLYLLEERIHPEVIVKVIGHQWYWSYESDYGSHLAFIFENVSDVVGLKDIVYGLVSAGTNGSTITKLHTFAVTQYWIYDSYKLFSKSFEDYCSKWAVWNLMWQNSALISIVTPFTDKESLSGILGSLDNYNYLVDYSSVSNSNEYFATNVLETVTLKEMSAPRFMDVFDSSETLKQYFPFFWVDNLFTPFNNKYLWLDIDYSGDYMRHVRAENFLTHDKFEGVLFDLDVFDSYLLKEYDMLYKGEKRLLEVDNRLVLPIKTHVQLLVTSTDVIHSFAVPAFGVKIDAIPGRLNQCFIFIKYEGTFFGQCSELCGVDHGYMPIAIEAVSFSYFISSVKGYAGYYDDLFYSSGWEIIGSR